MRRFLSSLLAPIGGEGMAATLVKSVASNGVVRIVGILASFTVGIQLARGLGVTNFGYYSIALSMITLAEIPGEFGLPTYVTREVAAAAGRNESHELFAIIRWAKRSCRWIALAIAGIVIIGALLLRELYSQTLLECILIGAPAIPLMASARVRSAAIWGLNRVARAQLPEAVIRPVIFSFMLGLAFLFHLSLSPQLAMGFFCIAVAVVLAFSSVWLRQALPERPVEPLETRKRSITSSAPMGLMEGMRVIQGELSIVLAGLVAVPAVVGLLRIANVAAMTAAVPLVFVVQVGMPLMAKLHAIADHAKLQKVVTAVAQAQFAGVVLLSLPLFLFPAPLLSFAFGRPFAEASGALQVLIVAQIVNGAFGPNIWLLNMTHYERRVLRALGVALVINAIAVPLLASRWGATGGACALLFSMICWNVISWHDARKLLGIETSIFHWPWQLRFKTA
jgi:O-antigen/teichoic acid export membrane protein